MFDHFNSFANKTLISVFTVQNPLKRLVKLDQIPVSPRLQACSNYGKVGRFADLQEDNISGIMHNTILKSTKRQTTRSSPSPSPIFFLPCGTLSLLHTSDVSTRARWVRMRKKKENFFLAFILRLRLCLRFVASHKKISDTSARQAQEKQNFPFSCACDYVASMKQA